MADRFQVELIRKGPEAWNAWRKNTTAAVDLSKANFGDIELPKIDLRKASLQQAQLRWAYLREAQLTGADLSKADLRIIDLSKADLRGADLSGARLDGAYLRQTNLEGANLSDASLLGVNLDRACLRRARLIRANLRNALLVDVDLSGADISGCRVYGTSVWNVDTTETKQENLKITGEKEATVTVDSLKVAQFIYLLLNNRELRDVIDTITSKIVLIIGRFTPERKGILDQIRKELRRRNYLPVIFDFEVPRSRDTDETLGLLARMASFVVADLTDAKSVLQELRGIVSDLPSVPVQPIIHMSDKEPGMFDHFRRYPWVLEPFRYSTNTDLILSIGETIVAPAEAMKKSLRT